MDCIILAGGLGTRLRPVVPHLPKALAPIQGVPFLKLIVQQLLLSGVVSKIILAVGYLAEQVEQAFQNVPVEFSREEAPLGTGGATLKAMGKTVGDPVLVINGDTYLHISLSEMLVFHQAKGAAVTLACREVENAERFGTLDLSAEGQILGFREKARRKGAVNCGFYLFNRSLFEKFPFEGSFSLERDLFPYLVQHDKMFGFLCDGAFIDIGTPESFAESQELLRSIL